MSAGAIREQGRARAANPFALDAGNVSTRRSDAQLGIKEIQVLRSDLDLVDPSELLRGSESVFAKYRGDITSGDELRLPLMSTNDGPGLRAAVARVITKDCSAGASREDVMKEEKMLRVLRALDQATSSIQRQANMGARY